MTPLPLTRRARRAFAILALTIVALGLTGIAVVLGPTQACRLALALSLVAAFNLALLHNLRQAHAISRHRRRKSS